MSREPSAIMPASPPDDGGRPKALPWCTRLCYGSLRTPLCAFDFLIRTPVRNGLYREVLGMPLRTQAAVVSFTKCLDFLLGFLVGHFSDRLRTRYGRRKPFIAILMPVFVLCMALLANPPASLGSTDEVGPALCSTLAGNQSDCMPLEQCLTAATANGSLPLWNATSVTTQLIPRPAAGSSHLVAYFAMIYFLYYATGWTGTVIPYDALGMELTYDYAERSTLFGVKSAFQFFGYLLQTVVAMILAQIYASSIKQQVAVSSYVLIVISIPPFIAVLLGTKEQQPQDADHTEVVPLVRQMLRNRPYVIYLLMRIPLTLATLMPTSLFLDVFKYVGKRENSAAAYQNMLAVALVACFLSIPALVRLTHWRGKTDILWKICVFLAVLFLVMTVMPTLLLINVLVYPFAICVGVAQAVTFIIPDAILADIIDYDFLHTGTRTEGMYTILESNLQQYVEIVGGVLPNVFMGLAGFINNGGCMCGCGVPCPVPFLRWHCPGDIGYACSENLGASLLFGDPGRSPPCTEQNASVLLWIRWFTLGLPGIMYFLAAIPAYLLPIDGKVHSEILHQIQRREAGEIPMDPLTHLPVVQPAEKGTASLADYLWHWELALGRRKGLCTVLAVMASLLATWLGLVAVVVTLMWRNSNAESTTFGSLGLAALFVLVPWEFQRLLSVLKLRRAAAGGSLDWHHPSEHCADVQSALIQSEMTNTGLES